MNYVNILLVTVLTVTVSNVNAQNLVINGDFEASGGQGVARSFNVTESWYNRAGEQTAVARRSDLNLDGSSFNAVIVDRSGKPFIHSQKMEHLIAAEDIYAVRFDLMANAVSWNNRDFVRVLLFATQDNQVQGKVVWEHIFDGAPSAGMLGTWEAVGGRTDVVATEAVGKRLFINFYGMDPFGEDFGKPGYARLDNLSVTVVQQPSQ
jgi:hypothetical protein